MPKVLRGYLIPKQGRVARARCGDRRPERDTWRVMPIRTGLSRGILACIEYHADPPLVFTTVTIASVAGSPEPLVLTVGSKMTTQRYTLA